MCLVFGPAVFSSAGRSWAAASQTQGIRGWWGCRTTRLRLCTLAGPLCPWLFLPGCACVRACVGRCSSGSLLTWRPTRQLWPPSAPGRRRRFQIFGPQGCCRSTRQLQLTSVVSTPHKRGDVRKSWPILNHGDMKTSWKVMSQFLFTSSVVVRNAPTRTKT